MNNSETNPERCRQLRENLRQIQSELSRLHQSANTQRSKLRGFRRELSQHYSDLEILKEAEIALRLGTLVGGAFGQGAGASSAGAAARIVQLEHKIQIAEARIESLIHDLEKIQTDIDRYTQYEGESGREMTQRNCVSF